MVAPAHDLRLDEAPTGLKLDLACGQRKQEGFIGVDRIKTDDVDMVVDLTRVPWPWDDNEVGEVFCSRYVEHTPDLNVFMDELWRVLAPDGRVTILHPYGKSSRAFQDNTHVRYIVQANWFYFSREWRELQKLDHYGPRCNFEVQHIAASWNEQAPFKGHLRSEPARDFALAHYWDVVDDLTVLLRAIKD